MFSSKSFIKAFRTFSTKLNDDGFCFSRHYKLSKSVVILCLTLTVCLGEDVKSVNGCVGNFMFSKSMNKCIGRVVERVNGCTVNNVFNKTLNRCIDCPNGSFGPGCIPCLPKKYGRFCASTCNCSAEQCNAITGCSEGTTTEDRVEGRNSLETLSTEFSYQNHFTSTISPNSSSSPVARKAAENKYRTSVVIAVAGTFISTLLLVAIGFQLRSRIILCQREHNDQHNMFCENGNVYAEANNVR